MHIVWTMANNSSVPYFTWFADQLLNHKQHQLTFIILYPEKPEIVEEMASKGISCYWIPFNAEKRLRSYFYSIPKLYKLVKELKPDVLHAHLFDDALPALIAARLAKIKIRAITKADAGFHWHFSKKAVPFDLLNNINANLIVAISSENKQFVITNEKANRKKTVVIHHGIPDIIKQVDKDTVQHFVDTYHLKDRLVLGVVSRLIEWKGVLKLLEQLPALIKKYPNVIVLICGDGPEKQTIIKFIADNKLSDYVILTGRLDKKAIPSFYASLDIFIHMARLEPFGLVISEAMMCGTPIISTPTGAAGDAIVHKSNGFIIPYNSYDQIADGIAYTLNHKEMMANNARTTALDLFTIEKMYNNHINAYHKLLNANR